MDLKNSIHRGKMLEGIRAYRVLKRTLSTTRQLYSDTEACSPDGNTNFFKIVDGVLQGDLLATFLFIIALHYAMKKVTDYN